MFFRIFVLGNRVHLQDQKAVSILPDDKGVRFDVALDGEDEICDIEMQNVIDMEVLARSFFWERVILPVLPKSLRS